MKAAGRLLVAILTHQPAAPTEALVEWWQRKAGIPAEDLLIVHGGNSEDFSAIDCTNKVFVEDARLRTRDHQREKQSYSSVTRAISAWMAPFSYEFVYFVEFDQIPIVPDFADNILAWIDQESADVVAHHLSRIDATNSAHYLFHASDPRFHQFFEEMSCRADKRVVLSMFGTGALWRRLAFDATASMDEPIPVYLELWMPTVVHHLGYRIRPWPRTQDRFVHYRKMTSSLEAAKAAGAWTVHPVKSILEFQGINEPR